MPRAADYQKLELAGWAMKSSFRYMDFRFGTQELNTFLAKHGASRSLVEDSNGWISYDFSHDLLAWLDERDSEAVFEAGVWSFKPEVLGKPGHLLLKTLGSPSLVFKLLARRFSMINRCGDFIIKELQRDRAVLEYKPHPGYHETDKLFCRIRQGQYSAVPTIWNLPLASCKELACMVDGQSSCIYELSWKAQASKFTPVLGGIAGGGLVVIPLGLMQGVSTYTVPLLTVLACSMVGYFAVRLHILNDTHERQEKLAQEQQEALEISISALSAKYAELQEAQTSLATTHEELKAYKGNLEVIVQERTLELEQSRKELYRKSITDVLTGLHNRQFFESYLSKSVALAQRYDKSLALVMLDIDNFKGFNDGHGHLYGDLILKSVANVLNGLVRKSDVVARYGGDEFVVVLPEASRDQVISVAQKICDAIRGEPMPLPPGGSDGDGNRTTVSVGVAIFENGDDMETFFKKVDQALYQAKQQGRDCIAHAWR